MSLIPVGMNYHVDAKGHVYKQVVCEQCQTEYYYYMEREALAVATSWLFLNNKGAQKAASKRAEAKLRKQLAKGGEPVPCPNCGWFQDDMIRLARREFLPWMRGVGRLLIALSIPVTYAAFVTAPRPNAVAAFTSPLGIGGIVSFGIGVGLILIRIWISQHLSLMASTRRNGSAMASVER